MPTTRYTGPSGHSHAGGGGTGACACQAMNAPETALSPARLQRRIAVFGIVQGVGFRPYVWRLAHELGLAGWVCNDGAGVAIAVAGAVNVVTRFTERLPQEAPPLAEVQAVTWHDEAEAAELADFQIRDSRNAGPNSTMIGPDTMVCPDCLSELFDPQNRRWRYALINCSHCGPRYSLTRGLPYDRAQTSMAGFALCPACTAEYRKPADRRFHAEPTACPVCGPQLWLAGPDGERLAAEDPIAAALARLLAGEIVAVKGLGGFHLACDAHNPAAVQRLRARKNREARPFAVMAANPDSLRAWAEIGEAEAALLNSSERPIVLLRKRQGADVALAGIAPGLAWLGAMLPYAPIHWLLFHEAAGRPAGTAWLAQPQALVLVMTSANPGGEPLVAGNAEAVTRLTGIADALLLHDRDIVVRCDDSVIRAEAGRPQAFQFIRRARGYTPRAIRLPQAGPAVLALGGQFKNTLCLTRGDAAYLSQHIGSLSDPATCAMLEEVTEHLLAILEVQPQAVAHDLHPDFFSTRLALELAECLAVPAIGVQHHHAHLAAVAAEHGHVGPLLGLALDGVGLGSDGQAWGGELLALDGDAFSRLGHLAALPLPGGDKAAREPWRMAAAVLCRLGRQAEIAQRFGRHGAAGQLAAIIERSLNAPPTTSLGRWFDAAAGLLAVCELMSYEGQAAMLLEGLAETAGELLPLNNGYVLHEDGRLDLLPLLAWLADAPDAATGAAVFHATLALALADWLGQAAAQSGIRSVALGGGCFLNHVLSRQLVRHLDAQGLTVLSARQAPPNDGGLSLGQAWVAQQRLSKGASLCV